MVAINEVRQDDKVPALAVAALFLSLSAIWSDSVLIPCLTSIYGDLPTDNAFLQGFIVTGPSLIGIPFSLLIGGLAQKFSKKHLMVAALLIFIVGAALCVVAQDMTMMAIGRAITGIAATPVFTLGLALVGELYRDEDQRNRMLGFYNGFSSGYGAFLSVAAGFLALNSWRSAFMLNAVAVVALLLVLFFLPYTPPEGELAQEESSADEGFVSKTGFSPWAFIILVLIWNAFGALPYYFTDIYVTEAAMGDSSLSGIIASAYQVGGLLSALAFGYLIQNKAVDRLMNVCLWAIMAVCSIILYATSSSVVAIVVMTIAGATLNLMFCLLPARVTDSCKPDKLTLYMSLLISFQYTGSFICGYTPSLFGAITGDPSIRGSLFCTTIIFAVVATIVGFGTFAKRAQR